MKILESTNNCICMFFDESEGEWVDISGFNRGLDFGEFKSISINDMTKYIALQLNEDGIVTPAVKNCVRQLISFAHPYSHITCKAENGETIRFRYIQGI